jgi:hypothetical protein
MCEWTDYVSLHESKSTVERNANGDVVPQPLFRAPPQPRGWLTEDERNGLDEIATYLDTRVSFRLRGLGIMVRNLLARSTPPEVVLPRSDDYGRRGDYVQRVIRAITAAGVPVKEVGRE